MSCADIKRQVYRNIVCDAALENERLQLLYPQVPRWVQSFNAPADLTPKLSYGRRLNNFCVGSDPEFALLSGTRKMTAHQDAGLFVGLAAGADQNERLAELRPWPSSSVVTHVAGILTALRWMYRTNVPVRSMSWRAGAYYHDDGLGGHVHFGRRQPTRDKEVEALNVLALTFASLGMFPLDEWAQRMHGDRIGQIYGRFGDTRPQLHGYEYRTLPSWLHSPEAAFVVLTASKLTLFDPEIVTQWLPQYQVAQRHLLNLARYYMHRDDDAMLMYRILRGQRATRLQFMAEDFKLRWGFTRAHTQITRDVTQYILPATIQPQADEIEEVFNYLVDGTELGFREVEPNFVFQVPEGYVWLPRLISPGRRAGVGDVIHNLAIYGNSGVPLNFANDDRLRVGHRWVERWSQAEKQLYEREFGGLIDHDNAEHVSIGQAWRKVPGIRDLRRFIDSGLLPIWTVENVQPDSYARWKEAHPRVKTAEAQRGRHEKVRTL